MHNPDEAKKSYLTLLIDKTPEAIFSSATFIVVWYLINTFILDTSTTPITYITMFFLFIFYLAWKPKLIRFLRGHLRGQEYRDKAD